MHVREATALDAPALRAFTSQTLDDFYDQDAQDAVRKSWVWRTDDNRRVLLVFEDDGELACVAGYGELEPGLVWFYFLAVACDFQHGGRGEEAFRQVMFSLATEDESLQVGWHVHVDNERCQDLCARLNYTEWTIHDDEPFYREYEAFV